MPVNKFFLHNFKYLRCFYKNWKYFQGEISVLRTSDMQCVVSSWEGRSMNTNRRTSRAGPLCAALHVISEHMPHAASSREGPFYSLAPGHCQNPFSWWSITLAGNSSMSVSSNKFEKHFSELSPLQKDHYADIHCTPSESSCYTQRKGPTHHSS